MNHDLISRDAVLDACSQSINILDAMSRIEDLPSVTPKQRTGHWEWDGMDAFLCSECASGYKEQPTMMGKPMFEYCPICGAKMEEQE